MNARKAIELCKERGLTVYLGDDGHPRLAGPKEEKTPTLLALLKRLRSEIITHLGGTPKPLLAREVADESANQSANAIPLLAREVERVERILCGDEVVAERRNPTTDEMQSLLEDAVAQGMSIRHLKWLYREGGRWEEYDRDAWYPFLGLRDIPRP